MFVVRFRLVRAAGVLLACGLALLTLPGVAAAVPSGDGGVSPFYTWGGAVPDRPGVMLRTEPLPAALGLEDAGTQLRILYSSTDGIDDRTPVVVSGALFVPRGAPPAGGWPVLAWAHGTTGVGDVCAPSWNQRSRRDAQYLNAWLRQGFAIVATDYQGLGTPGPHPYLMIRPEAYSVLDSVRAVLAQNGNLANRIVLVGQSQGGGATFAAAGIAPRYAPQLHVLGAIATGVPFVGSGVTRAPGNIDAPDPTVAYMLYLALMIQATQPAYASQPLVTEQAQPLLDKARTTCVGALFREVRQAGMNRQKALMPAFRDAFDSVMPRLEYSTLHLTMPVFIGTGERDHDVPPAAQLSLVRNACAQGSVIEAHLYRGLDHGATVNASLQDSIPFVRKLLAGEAIKPSCDPVAE